MQRGLKGLIRSLSVRLLIRLLITMTVVFAAYGLLTYSATSERWTDTIYGLAVRTGDLVKRATNWGMMQNRKEDVHQTIRMIAETPGVMGIRIYDKQGSIIFSADETEIGSKVDMRAEACVICHEEAEPLRSLPIANRMRTYETPDGAHVLGVIDPIQNEPRCSNAACHAHPPEQTVLGVLDVKMSMESLDDALAQTRDQVAWLTVAMLLIVGVGTVLFVIRVVRRPVQRLYEGTQRIAHGDLDTRIPVTTSDEVGRLAAAFNRMTDDLQRAREELMGWSHKLEREVKDKTAELGRIQRQVIHMEKMASLGKLSATVAHEINNPLAGILTYARLVEREVAAGGPPDDERDEVLRWLGLIRQETTRCGDIVRNLLLFARQSGKEFAPLHLNELMKRSLMLVRHHTEIAGVELEATLIEGDDQVLADADQIQQAVVALLVNAVEAMSGGEGRITVRVTGTEDSVEIAISDTGTGIPEDVLPHVFEPFFSTKDKESGVGLGLAVVYGIVQRHTGTIDVETEVGRGTTFRLRLDRRPAIPAQAA